MGNICAYHIYYTSILKVRCVEKASVNEIPDRLIIEPGIYRFGNRYFRMEKEGLYRLFEIKKDHIQRIVYKKDIYALLSGLCWIHSHGSRDDYKKYEEILEIAKKRKIVMTCGPFSGFVSKILTAYGIESRIVGMATLLQPNRWNDGHTLVEIKIGKKWILCDADQHCFYTYKRKLLSLAELIIHIQRDDYQIKKIANSYNLAVSEFHTPEVDNDYDYGLLCETSFGGMPDDEMKLWRKDFINRVGTIPWITEGNTVYSSAPDEKTLKKAKGRYPSFYFLKWNEFLKKFY